MNQLNTQDLVRLTNGQAMTSTAVIAKGTENTHEAVIRLTRTYQADLEEFGGVRLESNPFKREGASNGEKMPSLMNSKPRCFWRTCVITRSCAALRSD